MAHILRRVTFGPFPGVVQQLAGQSIGQVLDWALRAEPLPIKPGAEPSRDTDRNLQNVF